MKAWGGRKPRLSGELLVQQEAGSSQPVHLGVVTDDDIVLQVSLGRRNAELDEANLGVFDSGRPASSF